MKEKEKCSLDRGRAGGRERKAEKARGKKKEIEKERDEYLCLRPNHKYYDYDPYKYPNTGSDGKMVWTLTSCCCYYTQVSNFVQFLVWFCVR